jgi:hypothetical protein
MDGYRLLGYVVWRAGKWYLRRRLPSRRRAAAGVLTLLTIVGVVVALRRSAA